MFNIDDLTDLVPILLFYEFMKWFWRRLVPWFFVVLLKAVKLLACPHETT